MDESLTFQKESQNTNNQSEVGTIDNRTSPNDNTFLNSSNGNSSTQKNRTNDLPSPPSDTNSCQENLQQNNSSKDTPNEKASLIDFSSEIKVTTKKTRMHTKSESFSQRIPSGTTSPRSEPDPLRSPSSLHNKLPFSNIKSQTETKSKDRLSRASNVDAPPFDRKRAVSSNECSKGDNSKTSKRQKEKEITTTKSSKKGKEIDKGRESEVEKREQNETIQHSTQPKMRRSVSATLLQQTTSSSQSNTSHQEESPSIPVIEVKKTTTKSTKDNSSSEKTASSSELPERTKRTLDKRVYFVKSRSSSNLSRKPDKEKRHSGEVTLQPTTLTDERKKRVSLTISLPTWQPSENQKIQSPDENPSSQQPFSSLTLKTEVSVSSTKKLIRRHSERSTKSSDTTTNNNNDSSNKSGEIQPSNKKLDTKEEGTKSKLKQFFTNIPFFGRHRKDFKSNVSVPASEETKVSTFPQSDKLPVPSTSSSTSESVQTPSQDASQVCDQQNKSTHSRAKKQSLIRSPSTGALKKQSKESLSDSNHNTNTPNDFVETRKSEPFQQQRLKSPTSDETEISKENSSKTTEKRRSFRKSISLQNLKNIIIRKPKQSKDDNETDSSKSIQNKSLSNEGLTPSIPTKIPIFGTPLKLLYSHDGGVPKFVVRCIEFIERNGTNVEGIFRVSVGATEQQNAKNLIEIGVFDFSSIDPLAAAFLLKNFFAELPEPLFTFKLFSKFIECVTATNNNRDEIIKRIRSLLQELPVSHIDTMNYLFNFLHRFSAHSVKTLMDKRNLAIVFAPSLLRPHVTTLQNADKIASSFLVIETMIDEPKSFFENEPKLPEDNKEKIETTTSSSSPTATSLLQLSQPVSSTSQSSDSLVSEPSSQLSANQI